MLLCSAQIDPQTDFVKYTKQEGFVITERCKDVTKLTEVIKPVKLLAEARNRSIESSKEISVTVVPSAQDEVSSAETVREPSVSRSEKGTSKQAELTVYFDFDSYELSKDAMNAIERFLSTADKNNKEGLYVTGFTCKIGTQKYNDALALKRALSVKAYLESLSPELKDVLKLRWKGKCCYKDSADFSKNRRVEVTYSDPAFKYETEFYHKE